MLKYFALFLLTKVQCFVSDWSRVRGAVGGDVVWAGGDSADGDAGGAAAAARRPPHVRRALRARHLRQPHHDRRGHHGQKFF